MWKTYENPLDKFLATTPSRLSGDYRTHTIQRNYQYHLGHSQFFLGNAEDGMQAIISGYEPDRIAGLVGNHPRANMSQLIFNLVEANRAPDSRVVTTSPKTFAHTMDDDKIVDVSNPWRMTTNLGSLAQEIHRSGLKKTDPLVCTAIVIFHELTSLANSTQDIEAIRWILENSTFFGYLSLATITLGKPVTEISQHFGGSLTPILIGGMDELGRYKSSNHFVGVESFSDSRQIVDFSVT